MKRPNLVKLLIAAALLCAATPARSPRFKASAQTQPAAAPAQSPPAAVEHFSKDGLSFDYPAGWTLADRSSQQLQHLILARADSSALVMVIAQREPLQTSAQLRVARDAVTTPYVEGLAKQLAVVKVPSWSDAQCLRVGSQIATGFSLAGRLGDQPATGDVYTIVMGQRLLHLVYIRADKDDALGSTAWKKVIETLFVQSPQNISPEAGLLEQAVMGGLLNGKAKRKPPPEYPPAAKAALVQGTVSVHILVGENGDVIYAMPVSGDPLLGGAAMRAARQAKFSPTILCGRPVKVSGVITYNFVLR
jgi:TonB family protein